jgi:2-polyprenyl-3-methyl-5-hydroxy-6-metoxy-1,4-benzoquinol methylase
VEHSNILNNTSDKTHINTKDFLVSGESFSLIWNDEKKLLVTQPQPSKENLSKYYESSQYISHTDSKKGLLNFLYQAVKSYSLKRKVSLISKLNQGKGSLLDIGAGTGDFLKTAQNIGWIAQGVEVSEKARQLAFEKGIELNKSLDDFERKQFDVVTLWHVLEHLPNLENTIPKIEHLVKEDGCLIIAVPNFKSYDANYYKHFWAAYDVPRHLWHFSQESMKLIFSSKMKLVKTKPMIFDSFYVSLVSEKYKKGNNFSLNGFWIGLRSNLSAWKTKEYSSLIYVFKKAKAAK